MNFLKSMMAGLLLVAGTLATHAFSDSTATTPCNSLLWEISGNGQSKPSYLYGTMHVSQKVAFHLTDTFFIALNKCEAIALEEDPGTWMEELVETGYMSESRGGNYPRLNGNFYKNAFLVELPDNKDISQTLSFRSDLINNLLFRFYTREGNFEENTYLDLFIYQSAKKIGKPVIGLESFEEGQDYSAKASRPDSVKIENETYIGNAREIREQIENAYRKGDLDQLDSLSRISNRSRNTQKYLIDERNYNFVARMDSVMRSGTTLFTGVGAAHLPGEEGVINLLREKGYTVRAVAFKQSRKADKEKQKIENTFRPNTYTTRFLPDSSVSISSPGKLYKLLGGANSFYIYPDMVNGAYYSVYVMNRFEAFTHQSVDYTVQRIDSLLYENIPGKILERKQSKTNEGHPCFDITNRNRRGDASRYRIVVTPEYIYYFMVNGTGDYIINHPDDRFFESIKFRAISPAKEWVRVAGENGGYSIEMPGPPYSDIAGSNFAIKTGNAFIHSYFPADSSYYLFMRSEYPDVEYLEEDTFELVQLAEEFAFQFDLEVDTLAIENVTGRYPSLQATLRNDSMEFRIRIIVQGSHYNLLCCRTGPKDDGSRFLSSFRPEALVHRGPLEELTDTSMRFTVMTFPEKKTLKALRAMREDEDEEDEDVAYDRFRRRTFRSQTSDEVIQVYYRKFVPFFESFSPDSFWTQRRNYINSDSSFIITDRKIFRQDSLYIHTLRLTDTACTRGILIRQILDRDALYTLAAAIDTLSPLSPWMSTFFETFRPSDTAKAESVFVPKAARFFQYLCSDDTVQSKLARRNFWRARIDSTHVPLMIAWLRDSASLKFPSDFREDFIGRLASFNHPETIPFLKELYANSSDSSGVQIAILSSLAERRTREGMLAFRELLLSEAPLSDDAGQITSMFYPFYDSLELAKALYPGMLRLTRYPEYKNVLYSLLAAVTLNRTLSPDAYRTYLPDILHDANDELRRLFHAGNGGDDYDEILSQSYRENRFDRDKAPAKDKTKVEYEFNTATDDFAILLAPYYEREAGVKKYIDKLCKSKQDEIVMRCRALLLHDSVAVADSVWKHYSASKELRSKLYATLERFHRLDKLDSAAGGQAGITESMMYNRLDWDKDTAEFLEKRMIKTKSDTGYVYLYKFKREKSGKWMLGYNYLQPSDSARADIDSECRSETIKDIKDEAKLKKQIQRICKRVAMADRPRAASNNRYSYGDD